MYDCCSLEEEKRKKKKKSRKGKRLRVVGPGDSMILCEQQANLLTRQLT